MREVLVIAAGAGDPRPARTAEPIVRTAAKQAHARFADEHSDFVGYLNLWTYLREPSAGSGRAMQFRKHVPRGVPALPAGA